uniref:Uncharacterized protein n=1 Tax=Acrobeloides nanus TaxID=290746 RepID=A0A914DI42_9BILA
MRPFETTLIRSLVFIYIQKNKMKNFISFIVVVILCTTHIAFAQYGGSSYGLGTGALGYGGLGGAGYGGLGGNPYAGLSGLSSMYGSNPYRSNTFSPYGGMGGLNPYSSGLYGGGLGSPYGAAGGLGSPYGGGLGSPYGGGLGSPYGAQGLYGSIYDSSFKK